MNYYTERHGLRPSIERTYTITIDRYCILFECCERYFDNIAWCYPEACPDNSSLCCGLDINKFSNELTYDIPTIHKEDGVICKPKITHNIFDTEDHCDNYDQYALLDLIELIYENSKDIVDRKHHSFFGHDHLYFGNTSKIKKKFVRDINQIFSKTGLLYELTTTGQISRIVENSPVDKTLLKKIDEISEPGLKGLLEMAIAYHLAPDTNRNMDAVEKIWDALERLKTYYGKDKKESVGKLIDNMSDGEAYHRIFEEEFIKLSSIGNDFRIRHHETGKIEITDMRYYDYFFNRCLSLIGTTIAFLNN